MRKLLDLVLGAAPMFKFAVPAAQAYTFGAPSGIAGSITRVDESVVEPIQLVGVGSNPTVYPSAFGVPLKYVTGGAQQFNGGSETAPSFAGVLVREVPGISGAVADDSIANGTGTPWGANVPVGICTRGYVNVICAAGTPARGGVVYVQVVENGPIGVGAFRADGTDSGNAVALTATQAEWAADGIDANKNAELRIAR